MAKAAWKGYITIGQLGIPVRLYTAVQAKRPRFVLLHAADGSPVGRELWCKTEQRSIPASETVRAIEASPDRYITVTDHDLALSSNGTIKTIAVRQFCSPDEVATMYYSKPYYITPAAGGERAYALLREALARLHKAAIAEYVIYGNQHIAAIGGYGDLLVLQQLRYESELIPRSTISSPALPASSPVEVDALCSLIERLSGSFHAKDYHHTHTEHVLELIDRKSRNLPPARREQASPRATPEDQILSALHNTLEAPIPLKHTTGKTTWPAAG